MSVNELSSKSKRWTFQLSYNSIILPPLKKSRQFLNGLESEFITIRNTIPRPEGWDSLNVDVLTVKAREYHILVHSNRDMNKRQQEAIRPPPSDTPPPRTTLATTTTTPHTPPSTATARPRQRPPPITPDQLPSYAPTDRAETRTPAQIELMKEIGFQCHTTARKTF